MRPTVSGFATAHPAPRIVALAAGLLLALGAMGGQVRAQAEQRADVTLNGQVLNVEVVTTRERMARGLSGRTFLGPGEGMLFVYAQAGDHSFWMRDMLIPIDMVWIHNHRIVHIEPSVPPPAPGTPTSELPVYRSPGPANFVLEIAAGRAAQLGVKVGDRVGFHFN